ncbi:CaiB/BaiF CoA transferase family protein [Piscinibacter koreensis]|uniref:CoA transferase n=1 Tax=Piscinibacter koreensis TaxID=2742824 RepID=A0A7Y6NRK5_9BURK|nr:CaiB/BaiF CoA-transferase family protein [Schlegelella koreensis]NUZ08052.1 CoA transferase [Schlegelella koreensis]
MPAPHPSPSGPLVGVRVVEFAGIGPGPFACMLLSDMGADVVTIERPNAHVGDRTHIAGRGRRVLRADLKSPRDREAVLALLERADVLVEGFRPGVMERLGLGPDAVRARNPRLVYGRMTGWGQHGPLAHAAGHDIDYIAITGALHAIGPAGGAPVPPLNLLGDYGGGSLYLVTGILAALLEARTSGQGQVVDAAISDGVISLMSYAISQRLRGVLREERGSNLLDGGAPFYSVYETADAKHLAVGPIEPPFFAELCERIGLADSWRALQNERARWPELRAELARIFRSRTRDEWVHLLGSTDACVAPVLALSEAPAHPHNAAREAFVDVDGVRHPAPAPRFSRTPSRIQGAPPEEASNVDELMASWPLR